MEKNSVRGESFYFVRLLKLNSLFLKWNLDSLCFCFIVVVVFNKFFVNQGTLRIMKQQAIINSEVSQSK